ETWTATVDYGDGSGPQSLTLNADKTFSLSHRYLDEGNYTVTVHVTDDGGLVGMSKLTVSVNDVPPVVNSGAGATIGEGSTFTGAGSFTDPASDTWTATVDYGDGSGPQSLTLNADKTFALSHFYGHSGSFTVTVSVKDDDGSVGTSTLTVNVTNVAPVVAFGPAGAINEGSTFTDTGSFSHPGTDTWTATVDYGDGSGVQTLTLNPDKTFALSHLYADDGTYTVTVVVSDPAGAVGKGTLAVTVNDVAPVVAASASATINEGGTYTSSSSFADPGADTWTATVDYGDGSGAQALTLNADKTFALSHTYSRSGTFTVTVAVKDDDGSVGTSTAVMTVNNVAPVVTLSGNPTINQGQALSATGSFTDPGSETWTATVNYGDGSGVQGLTLNADK